MPHFWLLFSLSQRHEFGGLLKALESHPYHKIESGECGENLKLLMKPIVKYCPFVEAGILRISWRLQRSGEYDVNDVKHPIILPQSSPLTALIVDDMHRKSGHNAAAYVINELRRRFYIVGRERTVKHLIKTFCMDCRNR